MSEIISRKHAVSMGLSRYFTGVPCKRGHKAERRTSSNDCVECSKERQRTEKERSRKAKHYRENRDAYLKKASKRYKENRKEIIEYSCRYSKLNAKRRNRLWRERVGSTPERALAERIRCLIKESIKSRSCKKDTMTAEILGCSVNEFRRHIERQFTKGMSWSNFKDWHLDHIIPISSAKSKNDVIALNHFTNFRPMWASENISKSNKMEFLI